MAGCSFVVIFNASFCVNIHGNHRLRCQLRTSLKRFLNTRFSKKILFAGKKMQHLVDSILKSDVQQFKVYVQI